MGIEVIEMYYTTSSHLERYNDPQSNVLQSFSSVIRNIISDSDILHVVYIPNAHFALPVFSFKQILLLGCISNIMAIKSIE